jgi:hypothetical protein
MALQIRGHSDDTVCFGFDAADGTHTDEEIGALSSRIRFEVGAPGEPGVCITIAYSNPRDGDGGEDGVWSVEVRQPRDGARIPWDVRIGTGTEVDPYSVIVRVDCPPGTPFLVTRAQDMRPWFPVGRFHDSEFKRERQR